jgi:hypothetical protein
MHLLEIIDCNQNNMTGVNSGAESAYPSGAPVLRWGSRIT